MHDLTGMKLDPDEASSDEEKPLSVLLDKTKQKLPSPTVGSGLLDSIGNFGSLKVGDDEQDGAYSTV